MAQQRPRVDIRIRHGVADLVQKVDPRYSLSPEAEELLNDLVDEFINSVTRQACRLAASRNERNESVRDMTEVKVEKIDFVYALRHDWGIMLNVPSATGPGVARARTAHREALAAVENAQQSGF